MTTDYNMATKENILPDSAQKILRAIAAEKGSHAAFETQTGLQLGTEVAVELANDPIALKQYFTDLERLATYTEQQKNVKQT